MSFDDFIAHEPKGKFVCDFPGCEKTFHRRGKWLQLAIRLKRRTNREQTKRFATKNPVTKNIGNFAETPPLVRPLPVRHLQDYLLLILIQLSLSPMLQLHSHPMFQELRQFSSRLGYLRTQSRPLSRQMRLVIPHFSRLRT